uniref:uncharacterized protein LOC120337531 n=1 Tax=Styela clava TaxID=7725 RepID=UPI001939DFDB|nr:uncharacterized protein LOC120337531 [Styela clava]
MARQFCLSLFVIIACLWDVQTGWATHISKIAKKKTRSQYSQWSSWSLCSKSCGEGIRKRIRSCLTRNKLCSGETNESKHCFLRFCPSYLSWPRIHFSGKLVADVNTVNNIRCAYDNEEFSSAELKKQFKGLFEQAGTHTYYKFATNNWNPDGTNQIYFQDTFVTSFCQSPQNCSTTDPIVGLQVTEPARGIMAVLDVDWQFATEIWGFKVLIPGVLQGNFMKSSHQIEAQRLVEYLDKSRGYSTPTMSRYKSKLVNVTWNDQYYQILFKNSTELSISFVMDLYNQESLDGRISGTIGLSSEENPVQVMATRSMLPSAINVCGPASFFVHHDSKVLTIDLSYSIIGREDGRFVASDVGMLDLAILMTKQTFCKHFLFDDLRSCISNWNDKTLTWRWITTGGEISRRIGNDGSWYNTYGGIMDISIKHLDTITLRLLRSKRLAIMKKIPDGTVVVYMRENAKGVVIGLKVKSIVRLNPGESHIFKGFVSAFGKPVKGAQLDILISKNMLANTDCGRPSCNRSMGIPEDALHITHYRKSYTDQNGEIKINLTAVKDPGNIRGCGLDGQIYPLRLFARYKSKTFAEIGQINPYGNMRKEADFNTQTLSIAVRIYNSVKKITCPTWQDVKGIFIQYYNLYPAMWKNGIIDLHSYENVVRRFRMLKAAMFETDFNDARYMPITRDLSEGNKKLIWNWMKCGMKKTEPTSETKSTTKICTDDSIAKDLEDIRRHLHKAVMLELSTIPPYVTAWLSLKTEYGRNKEVADILKSVFNEEMLHMSLAGNVLNAVGGVVNMTDESKLPIYPNILASGDSYELCPDVQVSLGAFSLGLVEDIFSKIEKPSNARGRKLLHVLGEIWQLLPNNSHNNTRDTSQYTTTNMKKLNEEISKIENSKSKFNLSTPNLTANAKSQSEIDLQAWQNLGNFAEEKLREIISFNGKTVGEFYSIIALKMASLEACVRVRNMQQQKYTSNNTTVDTIFSGGINKQLNISHWYQQSNSILFHDSSKNSRENTDSYFSFHEASGNSIFVEDAESKATRPPLFEVTDLKTALEAIVEIVYQGEGGSDCSPFVTKPQLYASERGRNRGSELSHYYRFQEIVHGRKLIKVKDIPRWNELRCLNSSTEGSCSNISKAGEMFCYAGDQITFYQDGVWPLLNNPKQGQYRKGSKAYALHHQFNVLYTRLLFCIQEAFGGNPSNMKRCMSIMYDMTIVGKRLARTPLRVPGNSTTVELGTTGRNGCPTWSFIREKPFRAGLPIRT